LSTSTSTSEPESDRGKPLALVRATGDEAPGATRVVAGLPVIERSIKQLRRLGFRIAVAAGADLPLPPIVQGGPDLEVIPVGGPADLEALRVRLRHPLEVGADVVRASSSLEATPHRVRDEPTRRQAEDAVFAELLRGDLGVVARTLNKPISFRITRHLLCRLPVTPNQVTVLAGLIGLLGAVLIGFGSATSMPLGFLLAHLQSVLDGCDGELARVRLQQSAIGEWLDTLVDDALNLVLTAAIGIGLWRAHGEGLYLAGGLAAAGMLLFYNAVAYRELVRQGEGGEVLKVRWWFTRGASLKRVLAQARGGAAGGAGWTRGLLFALLSAMGRRDFFVFTWLVLALLGLGPVVLVYAFLLALANFIVAAGQLLTGRR
jgi:phosphatidylglycerophosphate synthase